MNPKEAGMRNYLLDYTPCAQDSHKTHHDPEHIEDRVRLILFEDGAPRKQDSVDRVEDPHEHKWTGRTEPTDEAKTEDAHQYTNHFNDADVCKNE